MIYDFDNNIPINIQAVEWLENQTISSELAAGDKLPSVRNLAKQIQVNPTRYTGRRGMGSFVTEYSRKTMKLLNQYVTREVCDFTYKMRKIGLSNDDIKEAIDNI